MLEQLKFVMYQNYWRIAFAVVFQAVMLGFVLPFLVSASSTPLVLVGVGALIVYIFVTLIQILWVVKVVQDSTKSDDNE